MPGKGKGKQKKKQQPSGQAGKTKTVKQPEENEFDSDIDKDDDVVDIEADDDALGNGEQEEATVKSKVQEDKHSTMKDVTEELDQAKIEDDVVEENGAVGNPPAEKKLTRKELKKMKKKAR